MKQEILDFLNNEIKVSDEWEIIEEEEKLKIHYGKNMFLGFIEKDAKFDAELKHKLKMRILNDKQVRTVLQINIKQT